MLLELQWSSCGVSVLSTYSVRNQLDTASQSMLHTVSYSKLHTVSQSKLHAVSQATYIQHYKVTSIQCHKATYIQCHKSACVQRYKTTLHTASQSNLPTASQSTCIHCYKVDFQSHDAHLVAKQHAMMHSKAHSGGPAKAVQTSCAATPAIVHCLVLHNTTHHSLSNQLCISGHASIKHVGQIVAMATDVYYCCLWWLTTLAACSGSRWYVRDLHLKPQHAFCTLDGRGFSAD